LNSAASWASVISNLYPGTNYDLKIVGSATEDHVHGLRPGVFFIFKNYCKELSSTVICRL